MLSKCANPGCSTPLIYLREGKLFTVDQSAGAQIRQEGPVLVKPGIRVEHFWLCGACSSEMTLAYDRESGAVVIRKPKVQKAVAS
jgi:hypothetical protein